MSENILVNDAKVMSKGQVTIQKFQEQMKDQAALAGFASEEDIAD